MKNIFLLSLLTIALFSCKKEVDELPPATQTGANTFGAKVGDKLWTPQGFGIAPTAPILAATWASQGGIVRINARNFSSSPTETEMEIYLQNVYAPGTFQLNQSTSKYPDQTANYGYYIERRFMPKNDWITTPQHTGSVNITKFDSVNRIISGTFQFTAASTDNTTSPLTVSDGRFDLKFQ